jgi:hypothetical protein
MKDCQIFSAIDQGRCSFRFSSRVNRRVRRLISSRSQNNMIAIQQRIFCDAVIGARCTIFA